MERLQTSNKNLISFTYVDFECGGRLGRFDVPCPECGPFHEYKGTHRRTVLRVYRNQADFASYNCARCGIKGYVRADAPYPLANSAISARFKEEANRRDAEDALRRQQIAQQLWAKARPACGTPAQKYLLGRGISAVTAAIRFLPSTPPKYPWAAMVTAFGMPLELEPGIVQISSDVIHGVHLTYLRPDGSGKAPVNPQKRMIGHSAGWPIAVAAPNDGLGLAISEGIEDALTVHEATGLGAWAAGAANRLPALADKVPQCVESVTIIVDDDEAGQRGAKGLAEALAARGFNVSMTSAGGAL